MKKYLGYIKGLFLSPNKTFKKIIEDKSISLVKIIIVVIVADFLIKFWSASPLSLFSPASLFSSSHFFISAFVFHVILILLKKKGSLRKLIIALSFVILVIAILSQVGPLLYVCLRTPICFPLYAYFGNNLLIPIRIASVVFILFGLYLKTLAISNVYSLSKLKSFLIVISVVIVWVLIVWALIALSQLLDPAHNLKTFFLYLLTFQDLMP